MSEEAVVYEGDIIQIDPDHDRTFGGTCMIVTEVRSWGVIAVCIVPAGGGTKQAPYRAPWGRFARIGEAAWAIE